MNVFWLIYTCFVICILSCLFAFLCYSLYKCLHADDVDKQQMKINKERYERKTIESDLNKLFNR